VNHERAITNQGVLAMNFEPAGRNARRKLFAFDAELDALVAREVDALSARRNPPAARRQAPSETTELLAPDAPGESRRAGDDERQRPRESARRSDAATAQQRRPDEDNVIGIRRADADQMGDVRFSAEEEKFIEQALAFLKGRENADVVIEELWAQAVLDRDDAVDEPIADVALAEDFTEPAPDGNVTEEGALPADSGGEQADARHPQQVTRIRPARFGKSAAPPASAPAEPESKQNDRRGPKAGDAGTPQEDERQ
jgi:hypothetical protein